MTTQQLLATCRSGVAQMTLEVQGEEVSGGTAFLVPGGLVTNSHVIRGTGFDVCVLRFDDMGLDAGIRLAKDYCLETVAHESPSD